LAPPLLPRQDQKSALILQGTRAPPGTPAVPPFLALPPTHPGTVPCMPERYPRLANVRRTRPSLLASRRLTFGWRLGEDVQRVFRIRLSARGPDSLEGLPRLLVPVTAFWSLQASLTGRAPRRESSAGRPSWSLLLYSKTQKSASVRCDGKPATTFARQRQLCIAARALACKRWGAGPKSGDNRATEVPEVRVHGGF
jgi:hypothetical protein